ncbi:MAG: hypothetical protein ABF290_05435 [Thiogranum sp.]
MFEPDNNFDTRTTGRRTLLTGLVPVLVFILSPILCAQDGNSIPGNPETDTHRWQKFDVDMSPREYEDACRNNRRHVIDSMMSYSEQALASIGTPEKGVRFMQAVAGVAASDSAKLHLNSSKLFALELRDISGEDQTLLLKMKLDWW